MLLNDEVVVFVAETEAERAGFATWRASRRGHVLCVEAGVWAWRAGARYAISAG